MKVRSILLSSIAALSLGSSAVFPDDNSSEDRDSLEVSIEDMMDEMRLANHNEHDLVMFGRANIRSGQYDNAIANLMLALEDDSTDAEIHYYLAKAYNGKSEIDKNEEYFGKALNHIDAALIIAAAKTAHSICRGTFWKTSPDAIFIVSKLNAK